MEGKRENRSCHAAHQTLGDVRRCKSERVGVVVSGGNTVAVDFER